MTTNCPTCQRIFNITPHQAKLGKKYCSKECASTGVFRKSGFNKIPTGTVGAISELVAASYLMKLGFSVFRALSPACACDILAIYNNKIIRIEVRTGYRNLRSGKLSWGRSARDFRGSDVYAIVEYNPEIVSLFTIDKLTPVDPKQWIVGEKIN